MTAPDFRALDADELVALASSCGWEDLEVVRCRCGMPGCQTALILGLATRQSLASMARDGEVHEHVAGDAPPPPAPADQRLLALFPTIVLGEHPPLAFALEAGEDWTEMVGILQDRGDPRWQVLVAVFATLMGSGLQAAIDGKMRRLTAS